MLRFIIANVRERRPDKNANIYHDVELFDSKGNVIASVTKCQGGHRQYEVTTAHLIQNFMPRVCQRLRKELKDKGQGHRSCVRYAEETNRLKIIYIVHKY